MPLVRAAAPCRRGAMDRAVSGPGTEVRKGFRYHALAVWTVGAFQFG